MRIGAQALLWMSLLAVPATTAGQVQTDVPAAVPGAKPVTVERIKVRGPALDRFQNDVLPFLHRTLCAEKACK